MGTKFNRYLSLAACLLMGVGIGFVVAFCTLSGVSAQKAMNQEVQEGIDKYTEIMDLVEKYYIGETDMTQVNDTMASGIIAGLGDRWSYYVPAESYQDYTNNRENAFVGVGITITPYYSEEGEIAGYEVTEVLKGGPSEEAGVLAGDVLVAVERQSIAGMDTTEVKSLVQGPENTQVYLSFLRGEGEVHISVTRKTFTLIAAEGRLLEDSVGYIIIDNFDAGCAETVKGLVEELTAQGATSLLFDVRNNPGGLKAELVELLDYLLPAGTVFHTVNYAGQEEIATSDPACVDLPMAVLVNESSYSAAEYFACALQEYGVGTVVGTKTYGKGYYQIGLDLSDGSAINLSIGKYYTPNGLSLIDTGVTPDVEVELDEEMTSLFLLNKLAPEEDPQVQAALNCLLP